MVNILFVLLTGVIIGIIDIIPMIIRKMNILFIISAFTFWVVNVFVISQIKMDLYPWLKGILLSLVLLVPTLILIYKVDQSSIIIVLPTTIILGAVAGIICKLITKI